MKLKTIITLIKSPKLLLYTLDNKNIIRMNDKDYIKIQFKKRMGYDIDFNNLNTFNEKLQYLKLYNRKDIYTKMVDKYEVKEYVKDKIGSDYIIKTLGIYNKFNEIDFNSLPNKFVIKCTHDSGGLVICKDKNKLDLKSTKEKIEDSLKRNFFYSRREWPYKNVKPRIIIEEFMEEKGKNGLEDYKIFCFNGKPEFTLVCSNRNGKFKNTNFYDNKWNLLEFTREKHDNNKEGINKPKNFDKMLELAKTLSKDIPFVRVDFYEINNKLYFGELTFFPSGGYEGFRPKEYDKIIGSKLDIGGLNEK